MDWIRKQSAFSSQLSVTDQNRGDMHYGGKLVGKLIIVLVLVVVAAVIGAWSCLSFCTSDLPDARAMATYLPTETQTIRTSICNQTLNVTAIPARETTLILPALFAAEGDFDLRGSLRRTYDDLATENVEHSNGHYSLLIARQMNCGLPGKQLFRQLRELRTAIQLERTFSRDQLLTIYLNSAYFGPDLYGIENASTSYLGKHVSQLTTAEAATLAGILRSPNYYSPTAHPDRAKSRRNEVIENLAKRGALSEKDAAIAKEEPLRTATPAR